MGSIEHSADPHAVMS